MFHSVALEPSMRASSPDLASGNVLYLGCEYSLILLLHSKSGERYPKTGHFPLLNKEGELLLMTRKERQFL